MISSSATVSPLALVPESTRVWDFAQIRENAVLGESVVVGRGAYLGSGVIIGDGSKIQNYALVYEPAELGRGVFVGPGAILTNDKLPRSVMPDMQQKQSSEWSPVGVTVLDGASIGAGAICVAPVTIGQWAMVAAGAVVVVNVPDHALVAGNPARRIGWVGRMGARLRQSEFEIETWECPQSNDVFKPNGAGGLVLMR